MKTLTLEDLNPHGILDLRRMLRTEPGWNPRNLSGYICAGMSRAEIEAYLVHGTLPNPEATAGRKATLDSGAQKYFGKGGDAAGIITTPGTAEDDDSADESNVQATAAAVEAPAPKIATKGGAAKPAAPAGLAAMIAMMTDEITAAVLAQMPDQQSAPIDEAAVAGIAAHVAKELIKSGKEETKTEVYTVVAETVAKVFEDKQAKANDAMQNTLADVFRALSTAPAPAKARAAAVLKKSTGKDGGNKTMSRLLLHCPVGSNPGNHVLVVGPSGTGKTYQARIFAAMHEWHTEAPIGLHKYLEPHHISGSAAPTDEGAFAFVSGAFRDGFLAASQGKTACILLDEILRASPEMMESLLTTLDPIPTSKGLVYRYRSGKPVKKGENGAAIWEQEVIECPVEKLTVVATANIGINYGIHSVDEAFWKRFRIVRIERNGEDERQIIATVGARLGAKAIKAAIILLDESRRAVKAGAMQYPACIRTLERVLRDSADVAELRQQFDWLLTEELTGWTEDGAILQAHMEMGKTILAKVLAVLD